MSKAIKLGDNTFLDSTSVVHNKKLLSDLLNGNREVILFNGSTTGDVVLSDNVSNYQYIEIIGEIGGGIAFSTKALAISPKIACIGFDFDNQTAGNVGFILSGKVLNVEGNRLTVKHAGRMYKYQKDTNVVNDNVDTVFITRVIGYKTTEE